MYRGKANIQAAEYRLVDERVYYVREWVANIFFYRKGDTTIMIDAGYNYDRLAEKMDWLGIDRSPSRHILITHRGHRPRGRLVSAVDYDLFRSAKSSISARLKIGITGTATLPKSHISSL